MTTFDACFDNQTESIQIETTTKWSAFQQCTTCSDWWYLAVTSMTMVSEPTCLGNIKSAINKTQSHDLQCESHTVVYSRHSTTEVTYQKLDTHETGKIILLNRWSCNSIGANFTVVGTLTICERVVVPPHTGCNRQTCYNSKSNLILKQIYIADLSVSVTLAQASWRPKRCLNFSLFIYTFC